MLKRTFDPLIGYRAAVYVRVSSDKQNRRSPDQQIAEIQKRLKDMGLQWVIVKTYRDDAISGRFLRKRLAYQAMLQDVKSGVLSVDLILVDTIERFGRVDELATIRKELYEKHGILVLSGDTNFCDPLTPQGKAMGMFEAMRVTEDGRIKAHNVIRGKRDIASRNFWPGGPPPFGYRLRSITTTRDGKLEIEGSVLEPEPEEAMIIALTFRMARETGYGTRLVHFLNANTEIPQRLKPFHPATVGRWLKNQIYQGILVWGANCTGIVDDTRVLEKNAKEDILIIPDFCEGLVTNEEWAAVNALINIRAAHTASFRQAARELNGKQITPTAPGLTIKYLLTGLVRCGHCGRSMTPSSSPKYVTKVGESKRYVSYVCPGYLARICPNSRRVPEDWLRQVVVGKLRERLFPKATPCEGSPGLINEEELIAAPWFGPLRDEIRREAAQLAAGVQHQKPALEKELHDLGENEKGWVHSLGKPDLDPSIRATIEKAWGKALARITEIKGVLAEAGSRNDHVEQLLDPTTIIKHLQRLHDVLAANNPTRGNLELSLHIDRINCFSDGKVLMRTCMLGALAEATSIVAERTTPDGGVVHLNWIGKSKPRRRAKLRVDPLGPNGGELKAAAHLAADPARFAHLPDQWFWQDVFQIPAKSCWAADHAAEVARLKATLTIAELAKHFGKSPPTIRTALRRAKEADPSLYALPRKRPRRRWSVDHAAEVAQLTQEGMSIMEIADRLKKSDTTIREALRNSYEREGVLE